MITAECHLNCSYCGGSLATIPRDITYDFDQLNEYVAQDSNAVVVFYGGEPLLRPHLIKRLLQYLPTNHFVLQTNGFFLERLEEHVHGIDTILRPIDGRQEVTDKYRNSRCYNRVGFEVLCGLTRHLVGQLIGARKVVENALPELEQDLYYPPFNNTTEIIP